MSFYFVSDESKKICFTVGTEFESKVLLELINHSNFKFVPNYVQSETEGRTIMEKIHNNELGAILIEKSK